MTKIRWFKYIASFTLLVYVLYSAGIFNKNGVVDLYQVLSRSKLFYLFFSLSFILFMDVINSFKWWCLSKSLNKKNTLFQLYCFCLSSRFYNLIFPSNVGGDVIRIRLQGKSSGEYSDSAAIIFVERLTGLLTLLFISIFILVFFAKQLQIFYFLLILVFSVFGLLIILWCLFDERFFLFVLKLFPSKFTFLEKTFYKLKKFRAAVLFFKGKPVAIFVAFFNSFLFYFFAIINGWLSIKVFDANVSFADMAIATPLKMLIMNLPISIGNIGLLEFSNVFVLGIWGITPAVSLSAAFLARAKDLISALIGFCLSSAAFLKEDFSSEIVANESDIQKD